MVGAINRTPTTLQSEIQNPKSKIRPAGGGFRPIKKTLAFYLIPDCGSGPPYMDFALRFAKTIGAVS